MNPVSSGMSSPVCDFPGEENECYSRFDFVARIFPFFFIQLLFVRTYFEKILNRLFDQFVDII
jgi:hypothetical protein